MLSSARVVSRRTGTRLMSSMFETKNNIATKRAKYYSNPAVGAENPTYLKEPTDKIIFGVGCTGIFIGLGCILSGTFSMANGINKTK